MNSQFLSFNWSREYISLKNLYTILCFKKYIKRFILNVKAHYNNIINFM
jgi:hypothetical protein